MSERIRGIETQVRINLEGQEAKGSFRKVKDWKVTHRGEIVEDDYIGEQTTDLDFRHDGFTVSFSIDEEDSEPLDFVSTSVANEEGHLPPQRCVMTVIRSYRKPGTKNKTEIFRQGILRETEEGAGSRKDRVVHQYEGKFKKRDLITG